MPPAYVKPYVKRGKTDAADAEAICEAVTRPTMRFVAVKSVDQQAVLMLYMTRDLLVRQRTALITALRAHLSEYGIVTSKGAGGVTALMKLLHEGQGKLPAYARSALHTISAQLRSLAGEVDRLETQILAWHRADDTSRRLAAIPGIDPITASAIAAAVPDASLFRSGRQFAAWLGLTPRPYSSGGKERLGGISKQGDREPKPPGEAGGRPTSQRKCEMVDKAVEATGTASPWRQHPSSELLGEDLLCARPHRTSETANAADQMYRFSCQWQIGNPALIAAMNPRTFLSASGTKTRSGRTADRDGRSIVIAERRNHREACGDEG